MEGSGPIRVLILYVHPLLGEGLAKLLAAEPGVVASPVGMGDGSGVEDALAARPDAVIVERRREPSMPEPRASTLASALAATAGPGRRAALAEAAPLVLFVDIDGAATPSGSGGELTHPAMAHPATDDLERVVRAVRDLRGRQPALVRA